MLIFRHLWHRRWQFHHVMAMGVSICSVQAAPAAPTVRRGTDNDFIDLPSRNYRAVMSALSGVVPRVSARRPDVVVYASRGARHWTVV